MNPYVTFEKENHRYTLHNSNNGNESFKILKSVTQIIQENNLGFDFSQIPNLDLAWYGDRGVKVHRACEYLDQKRLDWDTVALEILGYIKSYQLGKHFYRFEVLESEMLVFDRLERYAGTLDRIVKFDESARVVTSSFGVAQMDIKSGAPHWSHGIQTAGYNICLDDYGRYITQGPLYSRHLPRFCIYLDKDGAMPKLIPYPELNDFVIFESALNCTIARDAHQ